MKVRISLAVFLGILLAAGKLAAAQQATVPVNASVAPCPGGVGSAEIDTPVIPDLDTLIEASDLIIVGTVVNVLPAVLISPDHPDLTETHSLISIRDHLGGSLPPNTNTILLRQIGGKVGPCTLVVSADPLVNLHEDYVLFLRPDKRAYPPNTSGSPRYEAVGIWSGKAKIVNGKIEFRPAAHKELRQHDNSDANAFIELVKQKIGVIKR
jgi:hypothetical protein